MYKKVAVSLLLLLILFYPRFISKMIMETKINRIYDCYHNNERGTVNCTNLSELSSLESHLRFHNKLDYYGLIPVFRKDNIARQFRFYNLKGNVMLDYGKIDEAKRALMLSVPNKKLNRVYWIRLDLACRLVKEGESEVVLRFLNIIQKNYRSAISDMVSLMIENIESGKKLDGTTTCY